MERNRNATGLVIGLAIGLPASYFLQSGIIRAKLSLGAYLVHLPELMSKYPGDILPPVIISCVVLGVTGWFVGRRMSSST